MYVHKYVIHMHLHSICFVLIHYMNQIQILILCKVYTLGHEHKYTEHIHMHAYASTYVHMYMQHIHSHTYIGTLFICLKNIHTGNP